MNCEESRNLKWENEEAALKVSLSEEKDSESTFLNEEEGNKLIKIEERRSIVKGKVIDSILDNIGYTPYHKMLIMCCGLFYVTEGIQMYSLNMLSPILKDLFPESERLVVFLASALYIGYMVGTFFTGGLTESLGRRKSIIYLLFLYTFLAFSTCIYENLYILILYRFFIGVCIGIIGPQYISNLSEFLPALHKEIVLLSMSICYRIGVVYFILVFKFFSPNLNPHYWRQTLLVSALPVFLLMGLSLFYLRDSPKLLLVKRKVDEAVDLLYYIAPRRAITPEDIQILREEYSEHEQPEMKISYKQLFGTKFRMLILLCACIFLATSMVNLINSYSIPLILMKMEKTKGSSDFIGSHLAYEVLLTQVVTIPAVLISAMVCRLLGRKKTIMLGFAFCFLASAIPSLFTTGLIAASSFINFFVIFAYCSVKIYVIEVFPTQLRDYALSFCFFSGKLGDAITPPFCNLSLMLYSYGPMVFTNIVCLLGVIDSFLLPYDTVGLHVE